MNTVLALTGTGTSGAITLGDILGTNGIGGVVTWLFGKIPTLFNAIVANDLLLIAVGVSLTGVVVAMAIGIFKRV